MILRKSLSPQYAKYAFSYLHLPLVKEPTWSVEPRAREIDSSHTTMASWSPSTPSSSSLPVVSDIGSRILSESFPPDDSLQLQHTGPGGADLSLSELSLSDKPFTRDGPRFSLLAPQPAPPRLISSEQSAIAEEDEYDDATGATADSDEDLVNTAVLGRAVATKTREEKLQRDLFILKKLNSSFAVLSDALSVAKSATEVCMRG